MDEQAIWEAEFRGFFFGEGCITVTYYNSSRSKNPMFRPRFNIAQRDDDRSIVEDIQRRLGGHIYRMGKPKGNRGGTIEWTCVQAAEIRNVYRILTSGFMPSKKRRELELMGQFLDMQHRQGHKYTPAEKARVAELIQALKDAKKYVFPQTG